MFHHYPVFPSDFTLLTFSKQAMFQLQFFANIVGKGEIALNDPCINQNIENAGVAFVKGADERNELFEKINKKSYMTNKS